MIRFYLDQDSMDVALVLGLRANGIDLVTTAEAGRMRRDDRSQLEYAVAQGRVLYSANVRDFARLHIEWLTRGLEHPGVIVRANQRMKIPEQIRGLLNTAQARTPGEFKNTFSYLTSFKA